MFAADRNFLIIFHHHQTDYEGPAYQPRSLYTIMKFQSAIQNVGAQT